MRKILTLAGILCAFQISNAQQSQEALDYIAKYKDLAIKEMLRCHIPASITLAQGIHESGCGKSKLCRVANNHFGIKCTSDWQGKGYNQNDDTPNECFRVYNRPEDSYIDHSDFLRTRPRYSFLFELPVNDCKSWAYGLKNAGYATDHKYPEILLNTIELYNLRQYDAIGLAMMNGKKKPYTHASAMAALHTREEPVKPTKHQQKIEKNEISTEVITDKEPVRQQYSVNGILAIKATANEDPLTIAFAQNLDYDRIVAFNDLAEGEHFKEGEFIYLQSKKASGTQATCVVMEGESMRDISQKFGIKLKELYFKNGMKPNDQPYPGQTVYLQEKKISPPHSMTYVEFLKSISSPRAGTPTMQNAPAQAQANTEAGVTVPSQRKNIEQPTRYKVERSDTLYSIARKFNLSIEQLKALNNLQGSELRPGQTLVVGK